MFGGKYKKKMNCRDLKKKILHVCSFVDGEPSIGSTIIIIFNVIFIENNFFLPSIEKNLKKATWWREEWEKRQRLKTTSYWRWIRVTLNAYHCLIQLIECWMFVHLKIHSKFFKSFFYIYFLGGDEELETNFIIDTHSLCQLRVSSKLFTLSS